MCFCFLPPQFKVFHIFFFFFFFSVGHSEQVMKAWENGRPNTKCTWITQRWGCEEAYGLQRAYLRPNVTLGLLNLSVPPGEYTLRMRHLSVLLPRLAVKAISSDPSLNHCHCFVCYGALSPLWFVHLHTWLVSKQVNPLWKPCDPCKPHVIFFNLTDDLATVCFT